MDELDQWISHLSQCKQLTEADIKRLCDKASRDPRLLRAGRCMRPLCLRPAHSLVSISLEMLAMDMDEVTLWTAAMATVLSRQLLPL